MKKLAIIGSLLILALPAIAQPNFLVRLDPAGEIGPRVLELERCVGSWIHSQAAFDQDRDKRIEKLEADVTYIRAKPIGQLQKRILRLETLLEKAGK